ncbi:MAG: nuclear transport factor 2 family protein [Bacteroidetes bacterium]|nr:nuclear transport factor 2 family protein [Bacteroidota bacterium]MDA0907671.1 nuclear transport factor 2 family protein [Bacteroidota bacterium]
MRKIITLLLTLVITSINILAQDQSDEATIKQVLVDFKTAIITNDSEVASELLHDEVEILEGRTKESKEQYLSHHFHSDGRFLSAIERVDLSQDIKIEGNVAWVSTITAMTGTYNYNEIDLTSLELAVLKKQENDWKIIALHWSSR